MTNERTRSQCMWDILWTIYHLPWLWKLCHHFIVHLRWAGWCGTFTMIVKTLPSFHCVLEMSWVVWDIYHDCENSAIVSLCTWDEPGGVGHLPWLWKPCLSLSVLAWSHGVANSLQVRENGLGEGVDGGWGTRGGEVGGSGWKWCRLRDLYIKLF